MKATCVEQVLYYAWLVRCGQYSSYFLTVYVTQAGLERRTLPSASVFHVVEWQVYHSTQLVSIVLTSDLQLMMRLSTIQV